MNARANARAASKNGTSNVATDPSLHHMLNPINEAIEEVTREAIEHTELQTHLPLHARIYWERVQRQHEEAQAEMQQAAMLEEQAQRLRVQATAKQGAWESYLVHLGEICGFDPTKDRIESDGRIVRTSEAPQR